MPDAFFANPRRQNEELSSGGSDGGNGHGMIDDEDLRADEVDPGLSGDEDADETAAEKRLRLAKIYLDGVKTALGTFSFCYECKMLRWEF
jgi:ribosomal RNA-processing protein 9